MTSHRREFLQRTLLAGAGVLASGRLTASPPPRRAPNVVLILLDDLGYGDVGCYGQRLIQTPNIDQLARDGMRFTDCYAGGAVCAPSRSVLMTGLHGGHTPVRANAGTVPLRDGDVTVAELLRQAGYATGGFGKWGLGDAGTPGAPTRQGFDEFFGYLHQIHAHSYYPEFLWDGETKHPLPGNQEGRRGQYSADLIAERALGFVRRHQSRPFFLYACFTLPHAKLEVPDDAPYSGRPWSPESKRYAAMVTRADRQIGQLLALLREMHLERDTAVLFASDNGGTSASGHDATLFRSQSGFRGQKGDLYEGGIRVPMVVRWPGKVKAGAVSREPWAFCDFLPTAAEIAGVRVPQEVDGVSMLPTLTGTAHKRANEPRMLYWEQHQFDRRANSLQTESMAQAARWGRWKAIRPRLRTPLELYDLASDPSESSNVAARQVEVASRMESFLGASHQRPRPHTDGSFEFVRETPRGSV